MFVDSRPPSHNMNYCCWVLLMALKMKGELYCLNKVWVRWFIGMALLLGMAAVLFESRICKVFYSVHSRRPTNYHFFKQISMMILICFSLLHRRDKGLNLGVFSWSGVRFIMIDIIFWGFVLLCSIVLPSDKGDSDKDTLLKQKKPPLKLFLSPKGHRLTGCKFIIIY